MPAAAEARPDCPLARGAGSGDRVAGEAAGSPAAEALGGRREDRRSGKCSPPQPARTVVTRAGQGSAWCEAPLSPPLPGDCLPEERTGGGPLLPPAGDRSACGDAPVRAPRTAGEGAGDTPPLKEVTQKKTLEANPPKNPTSGFLTLGGLGLRAH